MRGKTCCDNGACGRMDEKWWIRPLWLAWHPLELLRTIFWSIVFSIMVVISFAHEAIDEAKR